VEVKAGLEMFEHINTPPSMKQEQAFPDAGSHVIACSLTSKSVADVAKATYGFAEKMLRMTPK
ncbi:MAG: hypothetical protein WCL21_17860, partial [Mariniphaga sp.]